MAGIGLQQNRLEQAASYLNELTTMCRDPRDWLLLGVCNQPRGNTDSAVSALEQVLEIDPSQPETYQILAPLYLAQGQPNREEWYREQATIIRQAHNAGIGR